MKKCQKCCILVMVEKCGQTHEKKRKEVQYSRGSSSGDSRGTYSEDEEEISVEVRGAGEVDCRDLIGDSSSNCPSRRLGPFGSKTDTDVISAAGEILKDQGDGKSTGCSRRSSPEKQYEPTDYTSKEATIQEAKRCLAEDNRKCPSILKTILRLKRS